MRVLGIGGLSHNASITLINDDRIELAVAIERITRQKHCGLTDPRVLGSVLNHLGIQLDTIDVVGWADQYLYLNSKKGEGIKSFFVGKNVRVFSHHDCHAASSFFCSPFKQAAIVTIDGKGDGMSAGIYLGDQDGLHPIMANDMCFSIGRMWNAMNTIVGMPGYHNSGKTMALGAYGRVHLGGLLNLVSLSNDGGFSFSYKNYSKEFFFDKTNLIRMISEVIGLDPVASINDLRQEHFDAVASLQKMTSAVMTNLVRSALVRLGDLPLCLSGGVALNAIANTMALEDVKPRDVFIQPASSDEGLSLGAAILAHQSASQEVNHYGFTPYLGRFYDDETISRSIGAASLRGDRVQGMEETVAGLLARGKVVGWFQGREEFGPRALGNRSILADPRNDDMKNYINKTVKHREWFRPFGPSILDEDKNLFFDFSYRSPFMVLAPQANELGKKTIPAALHVDGTGRIQTVREAENPRYYRLLRSFGDKTGVAALLNTSFNNYGEPIVGTPEDAIVSFKNSALDYLAIGDFLIAR